MFHLLYDGLIQSNMRKRNTHTSYICVSNWTEGLIEFHYETITCLTFLGSCSLNQFQIDHALICADLAKEMDSHGRHFPPTISGRRERELTTAGPSTGGWRVEH